MSDGFEQAFALAMDDLNSDQFDDPGRYLALVPRARQDEFLDRLTAAVAERGPIAGVDDISAEAKRRAFEAVAAVSASSGPAGLLPGALVALRKARGIEREDVLDHLAADFAIGETGRPALRRFYHRLESGTLLGSKVSHRLIASLAARFGARAEDFISAIQPIGPTARPTLATAMGRNSNDDVHRRSARSATGPRTVDRLGPDPDEALVERLFCGGPNA